jgi:hypothetical protein
MTIDKLAQQRSRLNKIREWAGFGGKALEAIDSEFGAVMDKLRDTDRDIREDARGIRDGARYIVQLARRRDYLGAATDMTQFHEACRLIAAKLSKFLSSVELKHYKVLLDNLPESAKEKLFSYDPNKKIDLDEGEVKATAAAIEAALIKEAGVRDWWFEMTSPVEDIFHNITNDKGKAMRALEKRFSSGFIKDLKVETTNMARKTYEFYKFLIRNFKELASALARRHLNDYKQAANEYIKEFSKYHTDFVKFHSKFIMPLKKHDEGMKEEAKKQEAERVAKEEAKKNQAEATRYEAEQAQKMQEQQHFENLQNQFGIQQQKSSPQNAAQPSPANVLDRLEEQHGTENLDKEQPIDLTKIKNKPALPNLDDTINRLRQLKKRSIMSNFIADITKFAASNDSQGLLIEILKQSEYLEETDKTKSLQLLAIAEGLVEEMTVSAGIFDKIRGVSDVLRGKEKEQEKQPVPFERQASLQK